MRHTTTLRSQLSQFASLFIVIVAISGGCNRSEEKSKISLTTNYVADAVNIDGKPAVYYELIATNESEDSISLMRLEVIDTTKSKFFTVFENDDLSGRIASIGHSAKIANHVLAPGQSAVIYVELTLPGDKSTFSLINNLEVYTGSETKKVSRAMPDISTTKIIGGAPLNGGKWTAIYEPSWKTGHRRVVYNVDSADRIPGRFAIDFVKMNDAGQYAIGNEDSIKNWLGYNASVLAVADGMVASTKNDFEESPTMSGHKDYEADQATGNYISINIGNETYVFYEHLKPGSIKVKPGDRVRKGDAIASLGYTGNTTGPHLHFHIANKNSPLGAEGIAYGFEGFSVIGYYPTLEKFGKDIWEPISAANNGHNAERPAPNSVITF